MQVIILAGGTGTRMQEITEITPKALIPIGGKPMIWHIMQLYMAQGFDEFILALGYKQEMFKMYFSHYRDINYDVKMGFLNPVYYDDTYTPSVILTDTGLSSLKGERLRQLKKYVKDDTFMLTYGDGVSNVNLNYLLSFHQKHGKIGTITGVHTASKFGDINRDPGNRVLQLREKPKSNSLTNGGFMVFNKGIFDYLDEGCDLEIGPLEKLAADSELYVYEHRGFWQNADTMKDIGELQEIWDEGNPPWIKGGK